ncbi:MAG: DUF5320 domain-containing protein [Spirochaetia bacterium]|nr:DUF5320 domain-containing protein [Spirochaetia bacterium]
MPRGDRSGPEGMGPRTGRAAGFCSGFGRPGYMNPAGRGGLGYRGMGYGRIGYGRGFHNFYGRGYRWNTGYFNPEYDGGFAGEPIDEKSYLEQELEGTKRQLETLEKRLSALNKEDNS